MATGVAKLGEQERKYARTVISNTRYLVMLIGGVW